MSAGRTPGRCRRVRGRSRRFSQAANRRFALGPARTHLDPNFQENLGAEQGLHVPSRGAGNLLQLLAAPPDHDRLVARLPYDDGRVDAAKGALFLELLDDDRTAIGNLVAKIAEKL